jgi:AcrR family transcriptional regulator
VTPGKTAQAPKLTKRAVVDRALELADSQGLDTLTIRKLATELGVTPMALYWHFRSKEELLGGLVERVWGEINVDVNPAAPWPAQLRTVMESLVAVLRAHPAAASLLLSFDKQSPAAMRPTEVTLEILRTAGFAPEYAAGIARNALWTGIMLAMSDPAAEPLSPEDLAEHQRAKQVIYATLPQATYPRLVECAVPLAAYNDPEFQYDLGVSIFIAGVEALAARRSNENGPAQSAITGGP